MQVRKFEARTMKEALEMVKSQLGPDAIILSAKDNSRRFGLAGQSSVEITAAVSEETLQKKKYAESKLKKEDLARIQRAPAKVQKKFIESAVGKYMKENMPRPEITRTQYIEIDNDEDQFENENEVAEPIQTYKPPLVQKAWNSLKKSPDTSTHEIENLRLELAQLKSVLKDFQKVPQGFSGQHPGAEYGLSYDFSSIFERLIQSGISPEITAEILSLAQKDMPAIKYKNKALIEGWVAKYMLDTTKVVEDLAGTQVQMFVGPSGSGKTSALVKLASHYVINGRKKVALVTTDTQKVGAIDQLRIYSHILNVPFAIIRSAQDWSYIVQQLRGFDYILCDSHGSSLKTIEEIQSLKALIPNQDQNTTIHLVLNATAKDQDLTEMGRRYKSIHFKDVIFSCVDDSIQQGTIYNFIRRFNIPIHSFGIGPRVPEDFEIATRERLLDLIFKLSKVKKDAEL